VVIYSAEGCEDNEETTVSLSPLAKPRFSIATYKDSVVVTNQSVDATSYMWDFGDGNTSANEDDYNIYDTSGNYTITLTATNNCGSRDSSFTISVTVPTPGSIGEVDVWNSVKLYPNPTSNVVNFSVGHKESGTLELNLTDVTGKTIWLESFVKSGFEVEGQVDLTELPKGVYFATFKLGNSELTKRIIKN
jgi:PKD repeat protein